MSECKRCPYCGEEIMADAQKCRHCGEWLNDEAETKQETIREAEIIEPESQPKQPITVVSSLSEPMTNEKHTKSSRTLLVVITIAIVIVLAIGGLFLLGSSESKNDKPTIVENSVEKNLELQVAEAYRKQEIYSLMTPDFQEAEMNANASDICIDWDYFYATQEDVSFTKISGVQAKIVEKNKAHVYVTLEYEWSSEPTVLILVMIRDNQKGEWLVDDVRTTGEYSGSIKQLMIDCANSDWEEMSGEDEDGSQFVVIDGSQLRLRLGPSTDSDTFKWPDGTNRHPDVGEVFKYLGESGDFYKIDYNGNEVWVSKQYTHLEQ